MNHHDKRSVTEIFNDLELGQVDRVDFNLHKKFPDTAFSIFVHFFPYQTQMMLDMVQEHAENRSVRFDIPRIRGYRFGRPEHWMMMRAFNPVDDTCKNIHQINDNVSVLEKTIERMEQTITSLVARINYLEEPAWLDDNELDIPMTLKDLAIQTSSNTHIRFPDSDTEKATHEDCPENDTCDTNEAIESQDNVVMEYEEDYSYKNEAWNTSDDETMSIESEDQDMGDNLAAIHPATRTPSPEDDDMDMDAQDQLHTWSLPNPEPEDDEYSVVSSVSATEDYTDLETRVMIPEWNVGTPNSNNVLPYY
jgi:hypothetical protein